ncbi:hypothetical protein Tco_1018980 [Tanacetum coccineum]|uniref:Uncharacterized protein n=1 Tax=Tanacetum coccineum TaxID=301880 RepID=A0ABQ5FXB4_9ASTR
MVAIRNLMDVTVLEESVVEDVIGTRNPGDIMIMHKRELVAADGAMKIELESCHRLHSWSVLVHAHPPSDGVPVIVATVSPKDMQLPGKLEGGAGDADVPQLVHRGMRAVETLTPTLERKVFNKDQNPMSMVLCTSTQRVSLVGVMTHLS